MVRPDRAECLIGLPYFEADGWNEDPGGENTLVEWLLGFQRSLRIPFLGMLNTPVGSGQGAEQRAMEINFHEVRLSSRFAVQTLASVTSRMTFERPLQGQTRDVVCRLVMG
jgi:hypothetical protein